MENKIQRENWTSRFELVGKPKVNEYTFKTDVKSEKSNWIYNAMTLYVDCGERHGDIICEMMGGYSSEGNNFIYARGKDENGKDNFSEEGRIKVAWEDRLNENILENIGDLCFITVGIEKDKTGKTFYKKFLSEYDAISYIKEHIDENMVLRIKGDLQYSLYNENVTVRKKIRSIVLSKVEDAKDFTAMFTQSVLLNKTSVDLKELDKNTGVLPIYGTVLDYVKEINGKEIKGFFPMPKVFEYQYDLANQTEEQIKTIYNKLFKVKKDVTQVNFIGELVENGTVTITYDDLPDEIKELVDIGAYPLEEALTKCTENRTKDKKMFVLRPDIVMEGNENSKMPKVMKFESAYTEEDLIIEIPEVAEDDNDDEVVDNTTESTKVDNSMDWLNSL